MPLHSSSAAPSPRDARAPLFVVSPHLDDAVFSCAMLLAGHPGSIVCSVFCGEPEPPQKTSWDRAAGHSDSSTAMRARIDEDERALSIVEARGIRLDFLDSQYRAAPDDGPSLTVAIMHALEAAWKQRGTPRLVAPLGLYHSDHVAVADACRLLARQAGLSDVIVYEDALYRTNRSIVRSRYAALAREGGKAVPIDESYALSMRRPGASNAKWRAVRAYRSQLRAFSDAHPFDLREPERYVRLIIDPAKAEAPRSSGRD